jgi:Protein of unknown function (DUF4238)
MTNGQRTKNQHYVPQFLLRRFADRNERIHVYDKHTRKSFVSSIRNVASENYFYDLKVGDTEIALEPVMTDIENAALAALNAIADSGSIAELTDECKANIAFFMGTQMVRTRAALEMLHQVEAGLRRVGPSKGVTPDTMPALFMDDEQLKKMSLMNLQIANDLAPLFLNKDWAVYRDPNKQFVISDHPLVRQNYYPADPLMGNNGIACEGIQIFMPLSPEFTLAFICPTLAEPFREHQTTKMPDTEIPLLVAIDNGTPIDLVDDCVIYQNSLQIANSNRFVFSVSDEFTLVDKMLDATPSVARPKYMDVR